MEVFHNFHEAEVTVEMWRHSYNNERSHSSLGYQTPDEVAARWRLPPGTVDNSPK